MELVSNPKKPEDMPDLAVVAHAEKLVDDTDVDVL
jgi:hypothetical protein